jgi:hypothetical protein
LEQLDVQSNNITEGSLPLLRGERDTAGRDTNWWPLAAPVTTLSPNAFSSDCLLVNDILHNVNLQRNPLAEVDDARCVEMLQQILRLLAKNRELVSLRAQLEKTTLETVAADPGRASGPSSSKVDVHRSELDGSNNESNTGRSDTATNNGAATVHPALSFALGALLSAAVTLIYIKRR